MTVLVAVNIPTGKVDEYTVRVSGLPALGGDVVNRLNQDAAELFEKVD